MQLWDHQRAVVDFSRDKDGVLIWHGMGSGKSLSTIAIIDDTQEDLVLILCPKTVIKTWHKEFEKYAQIKDDIEFSLCAPLTGTVAKKAKTIDKFIKYQPQTNRQLVKVVILNYEAVWRPGLGPILDQYGTVRDKGLLKKINWGVVVADETQKIKSPGSKVSRFVSQLKANKRLALSGTPTPNSPLDIYAIYRFLDKRIFSIPMPNGKYSLSYQRFKLKYAEWGGFENRQVVNYINQEDLNKKVYSIAHRIKTEDVVELPAFQHINVEVDLGRNARRAYEAFKKEALIQFENGEDLTAANVLTKYLRLAQIASGSVVDDTGTEHIVDQAKIEAVKDLVLGIEEPIVIFTRFKSEVTRLKKMISGLKRSDGIERTVCELTGSRDERDKFVSGEADIICVNLQAGGAGVNELVRARYGIYFSTGYSSGDYEQSLARIRRPGSDVTKTVMYYHITATNTIDEIIMSAIERKMDLIEAVLYDFSKDVMSSAA